MYLFLSSFSRRLIYFLIPFSFFNFKMLKYGIKSYHCPKEEQMDSGKHSEFSLWYMAGKVSSTLNSRDVLGSSFTRGHSEQTPRASSRSSCCLGSCDLSLSDQELNPLPPAIERRSLNHWTIREVLFFLYFREHTLAGHWWFPLKLTPPLVPLESLESTDSRWFFLNPRGESTVRVSRIFGKPLGKGIPGRFSTESQISSAQSLSRVRLFSTPWLATRQASLSITNSRSLLKLMPIESVIPSSHLILCCPLLLLPPIPPRIRVFSNESNLHMRWPKHWSFSFSISPSNEHPGLISFRMDWLDLLAVQGTLKSLLQHHSSKASNLRHSAFFTVQLSHPYMTTGKTIALTRQNLHGSKYILSGWKRKSRSIGLETELSGAFGGRAWLVVILRMPWRVTVGRDSTQEGQPQATRALNQLRMPCSPDSQIVGLAAHLTSRDPM